MLELPFGSNFVNESTASSRFISATFNLNSALGEGNKLLGDGTIPAAFTLVESLATPTGVIIANYKRAEKSRQVLWEVK